MTSPAPLLIHSRDTDYLRRLEALARPYGEPYCTSTRVELEDACFRLQPALLLLDLRLGETRDFLPTFLQQHQQLTIVALGDERSDPALAASAFGVYAVAPLDANAHQLGALIRRALDHAQLRAEIDQLRADAVRAAAEAAAARAQATSRAGAATALRPIIQSLHHLGDVPAMLERIAEEITVYARVTRVGIFMQQQGKGDYRLTVNRRCPEEVRRLAYRPNDPLLQWLSRHAHLVARTTLDVTSDTRDRAMLEGRLDAQGAEIIAPLHARGGLIGWLLIGHRTTGIPFSIADLEDLSTMVDRISTALENALLYEEVARQKSLAETLLHSLPTGVVATDEQGIIRWFSTAAQHMLAFATTEAVDHAIETLGSRLADIIRRTIAGEPFDLPQEWIDPVTHRALHVQTRRLGEQQKCLGAVAMIQDVTAQRALKEKQEQLERAAFWNELAASMSHEIRNPLVAIKTFAQLLPERYDDKVFRDEFSKLVSLEVDRLNSIIDQINDFAHPPAPAFGPVDIRQPIHRSIGHVLPSERRNGIQISTKVEDDLPAIWGDERALTDCFSHLLRNSVESLAHKDNPHIDLIVSRLQNGAGSRGIAVTVRDNGHGIPAEIKDKLFSPFCTTKARGMGLGLSIVQRTVIDHNGQVQIDARNNGTAVTVILPAAGTGEKL